ncbi:MAG: hypothetical protein R6V83_03440 [Candidatus Thorarchaeota archaeon]
MREPIMSNLLVTLTPAEGKRLIAKGLLATDDVQYALEKGYLCITLGTTSAYLVEELVEDYDKTRHIAGLTIPDGLWVTKDENRNSDQIFHKGERLEDMKVLDILDDLGPDDVIIKSANALDVKNVPVILLASKTGGSIGSFIGAVASRGIELLMPVGLEKSIPVAYEEYSGLFGMYEWDHAIGTPVGAISVPEGIPYTEIDALRTLFDVDAIPIAAGGVNGAEGCVTLYIEGSPNDVEAAYDFLEQEIKGEPVFPTIPDLY